MFWHQLKRITKHEIRQEVNDIVEKEMGHKATKKREEKIATQQM